MDVGAGAFERYRSALPILTGGYSRTLLRKTADYELVAMLWTPGCRSPIHDHADSRCWVLVLEGAIDVANFERLDDGEERANLRATGAASLCAGARDHRLNWRELHRVGNSTAENAYSLQLYAPRLTTYRVVEEETQEVRFVPARYDAVFDL